jgi:transcriptional regulator with XRE-family HTH domain
MANFFEDRRERLKLNRTQIAARLGITAAAVRVWELEQFVPGQSIASLAAAYEVTEKRMADEVMALRQRIEAKRELAAAGK